MTDRTAEDRFWPKVRKQPGEDGCWIWVAGRDTHGYGRFYDGERGRRAHRWSYEHFVGPIPDGLQLDHLCRVRNCVRPDHLEPVTNLENQLRGEKTFTTLNRAKTHCPRGHPYDEVNTRWIESGRKRKCHACEARIMRERRAAAAEVRRLARLEPAAGERS